MKAILRPSGDQAGLPPAGVSLPSPLPLVFMT
jgi:hypothetical protein